MKCTKCGDDLVEVRRVVESEKSRSTNLVVAGLSSKRTGRTSCKRGGPHSLPRPEKMTSSEIWSAINNQQGENRGI